MRGLRSHGRAGIDTWSDTGIDAGIDTVRADIGMPGRRATRPVTGDVLFDHTFGRRDLPGGELAAMDRTLSSTVMSLADETVVLPGHGARTTIGRERSTNPFLISRPAQPG